ncbi:MAG: hypothetical protein M3R46_09205 [Actinomycetota bacterium]|jgi:hypothetical protein|nr:hypothetical protein [Actinomycetota bacterium]
MKLFICWGLFRTPRPGHPCRNAHDALHAAGYAPDIIRARGWGLLPVWLNRTAGRREVRRLTGNDWVPALVTDDDIVIHGSQNIAAWAAAHPKQPEPGLSVRDAEG